MHNKVSLTHGMPINPTSTTLEAFRVESSRYGSLIRVAMPAYRGKHPPVKGWKLIFSLLSPSRSS